MTCHYSVVVIIYILTVVEKMSQKEVLALDLFLYRLGLTYTKILYKCFYLALGDWFANLNCNN